MFLRILIDSYRFFDRRWSLIIAAAFISLGLVECIVLAVHYAAPGPALLLDSVDGSTIPIGYDDLLESLLLLLSKIWFDGFIAYVLKLETKGIQANFKHPLSKSIVIYPRLLLISLCAQLLILPSILAAILISPSDPTGIMTFIPLVTAIVLFVWFSLVIPVVVIEEIVKVFPALKRSRYLVHRYFFMMFAIIFFSSLPSFALLDVSDNSIYTHMIAILLYFATMTISSIGTLFAYMHLKMIKGEQIMDDANEAANENS